MKKFLKALGISGAYFAFFTGLQILVTMAGALFLAADLVSSSGMALLQNTEAFRQRMTAGLLEHMTGMVLVSNLLTILCFFLFFRIRNRKFFGEIGLMKTSVRNLVLSSLFGFGMCFFVELLTRILPVEEAVMEEFETQHSMLWFGDAGLTFLSVAIAGPVSEEICFRGLCYTRLKSAMKPWLAALISSVFFGLAHGDPVWFLVGFAAGLSLAWVFETTGSLLCPITVHVTNNAISSMTAYVAMPEGLHKILLYSSILVVLASGAILKKSAGQERKKEEAAA